MLRRRVVILFRQRNTFLSPNLSPLTLRGFLLRMAVGIDTDLILQVIRDSSQRAGQAEKQLRVLRLPQCRLLFTFARRPEWQERQFQKVQRTQTRQPSSNPVTSSQKCGPLFAALKKNRVGFSIHARKGVVYLVTHRTDSSDPSLA